MNDNSGMNREYKDRLFKFIFANPENKEWTLSLYNSINNSSYTNPDDIQLNTIENAVYMSMKNDVSFLIEDTMNFYEQQSSYNPNMPMRFLIYAGMVYAKFVKGNKKYHQYSSTQQKAPTPRCICFYNGIDEKDDRKILKLSDSFKSESDIEVYVTMININYGHNSDLMSACKPLKEYSWFVEEIRSNQKTMDTLSNAVDAAIEALPDSSLIKPYLVDNRNEVKIMCITEYDEQQHLDDVRKESFEIGFLKALKDLVNDGILTLGDAAKRANMSVSEFKSKSGLMG